jgi:serine/threonine protein kinase
VNINDIVVKKPELNIFCINCLQTKGNNIRCPKCGYDERKYKVHPLYLKPKTILNNQYLIGKTLGQGGFGVTYLGQDLVLQKKVAIKEYLPAALATRDVLSSAIIPINLDAFQQGLDLFLEEARHLAKFDHPNIVHVINFFQENNTGYMVMEYLEGISPIDILNQSGGFLTVNQALEIILPIFNALATIHEQHIYHRDISIQNIIILEDNRPVLIDFGAARYIVGEYSHSLDLVLKDGYSPLEQYSSRGKIGPWTDIYACGALLYQMITGELPPAATDRSCQDNLISPADKGIDISATLNAAIMRALAIKLEQRFHSVEEFKAALLNYQFTPSISNSQFPPYITPSINYLNLFIKHLILLLIVWLGFYSMQDRLLIIAKQNFTKNTQQTPQVQKKNNSIPLQVEQEVQKVQKVQEVQKVPEVQPLTIKWNQLNQTVKIKPQSTKFQAQLDAFEKKLAQQQQQFEIQNAIELQLTQQQHEIEIQKKLTKQLNNLQAQTQATLDIKTTQPKSASIQQLLKQAQQQQAALNLTTPIGNNAYESYKQILELQPNNPLAQQGLMSIADKYERLANQKINRQKKLLLIERGLKVAPKHPALKQLQQQTLITITKPNLPKSSKKQTINNQSDKKPLSSPPAIPIKSKQTKPLIFTPTF